MVESIAYTENQIKSASYPDLEGRDLVYSKFPLLRLQTPNGRVYYKDGEKPADRVYIYSSTSILGATLRKGIGWDKWLGNSPSYEMAKDYGNQRAHIGTMTHALCMYLVWGEIVDTSTGFYNRDTSKIDIIPDEVKLRLSAFIDFCKQWQPRPIATEISLYCKDSDEEGLLYPWAGTADNIMKFPDGKLWLIDIKTGKEYKQSHQLQLTSYKILWDHLHGDKHGKIDKLACLYLTERGNFKIVEYNHIPVIWYNIYDTFEYLLKDKRGNMPKIKEKKELPIIYSLKGDSNADK